MTKQEYITKLLELYRIANMSDVEGHKYDWLPADACAVHCQAFDKVLDDLGYDGNYEELG